MYVVKYAYRNYDINGMYAVKYAYRNNVVMGQVGPHTCTLKLFWICLNVCVQVNMVYDINYELDLACCSVLCVTTHHRDQKKFN